MLHLDTLRQVSLLAALPQEQLHWLAEQGTELWLQPGEVLRAEGEPAEHVFLLLSGQFQIIQTIEQQEILLTTHSTPTLFGELPILMGMSHFWASGRAVTPCHILELENEVFWRLLMTAPTVTVAILRTMAKRWQEVQSLSLQREKLVALGTLAAGLAHELNNPASAGQRAARQLQETLETLHPLTLRLGQRPMLPAQQAFLADSQQTLLHPTQARVELDPLTQSDLEDKLTDWLEARGVVAGWQLAPNLVRAGLDVVWLERLKEQVAPELLSDVLTWLEATLAQAELLAEVQHSTERISKLVQAVKDYSYLDQAPLQEVDLHEGLESTLTILKHKLKGVLVTRDYDRSLPPIRAYASELNQVWTNLIDNAIDAVNDPRKDTHTDQTSAKNINTNANTSQEEQGQISIRTCCENDCAVITITDNGPGVPPNLQSRIFDLFFTTKGVGSGTGLGLNIAYRVVVEKHQGDIRLSSRPGETCFEVRLPIDSSQRL
ncbi:cyclic nucleotide-binding domain-containing protein [Leptolyngbya sp. FACHB-261]|nr:cyclic nucleotide-binding domain-containing protein [Leptolyngbya sp. FACHB-261]